MMSSPLRAFLLLRSSDGKWKVRVCHDIDSVIRSWDTRQEPDREVGVLHISFDQPKPQTFNRVAESHPGRMLLTAAAKHTVPTSYLCSAAPVGCAEDIDVFIGLEGWGYTLGDPTQELPNTQETRQELHNTQETREKLHNSKETQQKLHKTKKKRQESMGREPHGWIAEYLKENPEDAEALSKNRIFDDAGYLEDEVKLEKKLRHRMGLFRLYYIVGKRCDDPCKIAFAGPPWLQSRAIISLGVPLRAENVFRRNDIITVGDLADLSITYLLSLRRFGVNSLQGTLQAINTALEEGPAGVASAEEVPESGSLLNEVKKSLQALSERQHDILVQRLGFGTQMKTLQEIADAHGLTRERIRQIESQVIKKWLRIPSWPKMIEQRISQVLTNRSTPLPVSDMEAIDPWFKGLSEHSEFFLNFYKHLSDNRINIISINKINYFSQMNQETWDIKITEASMLLSSGAENEWTEDYTRSQVQELLPYNAKEFGDILWDRISGLCHFSTVADGSRILTGYGRSSEHLVKVILQESETPLHFEEIARRLRARFQSTLVTTVVHFYASKVGYLLDRGVYGLRRHIPFTDSQMTQIRCEAEHIVTSDARDRQWHNSEIIPVILERLGREYSALDKYILDIALGDTKVLKDLGRMTWVAATDDSPNPARIDLHQTVIEIVRAAGRPLKKSDILKRMKTVRGTDSHYQIFPADPLIRIKPGTWGINDRDVPIPRDEQPQLIEQLVQCLKKRRKGIHSTEVAELLPLKGFPPNAFFSIASPDDRLKISPTQYIYLAKWGNPRRESISQAVAAVLESTTEPLTLDEIVIEVEHRVGRKVNRNNIFNAMRPLDTTYDRKTSKWSPVSPAQSQGNTDPN